MANIGRNFALRHIVTDWDTIPAILLMARIFCLAKFYVLDLKQNKNTVEFNYGLSKFVDCENQTPL